MRILFSIVCFVLSAFAPLKPVEADETPLCERRLRGRSYECIAAASDPAGICYRRCMTVVDTADGFIFEQQNVLGGTTRLSCTCGPVDGILPGPLWFGCTADGPTAMIGKVTRAGRRIRRGATDYQGAWYDVFTCKRSESCVPSFFPCAQLATP